MHHRYGCPRRFDSLAVGLSICGLLDWHVLDQSVDASSNVYG